MEGTMIAMQLDAPGARLRRVERPLPVPGPGEIRVALAACGVCRTDPEALKRVRKGGRVICAGIHMSDIPAFPYADLWEERSILSVANLTRADGIGFLALASRHPVETHVTAFPLDQANEALALLRSGKAEGAIVLRP